MSDTTATLPVEPEIVAPETPPTDLPEEAAQPPVRDPRIVVRDQGSHPPELGKPSPLYFDPQLHGLPKDARIETFKRDPTRSHHWIDALGNVFHLHPDFPFWQGHNGREGQMETILPTTDAGASFEGPKEYVVTAPDNREIICPDYDLALRVLKLFDPPAIEAPAPDLATLPPVELAESAGADPGQPDLGLPPGVPDAVDPQVPEGETLVPLTTPAAVAAAPVITSSETETPPEDHVETPEQIAAATATNATPEGEPK